MTGDQRMPGVLMVTTRAQPDLGGIESHVAEVARRLASAYDLEVATTDRSGELPSREQLDGYLLTRWRAHPRARDYYFSPTLFRRVLGGDYDLLHIQGVHTLVPPIAMVAAVLRGRPFVVTFHTGGSSHVLRERLRHLQWRLLAPLLRRAAVLIAVSDHEAALFETALKIPAGTIRVVRNGGSLPVPPEPVPVEYGLILSTGRLERYKGHQRVIEALPAVLEKIPQARVRILGDGPYRAELLDLARRLGVGDRVSVDYIAPRARERMAREIAAASVVALLSDYEAHPVAVMEALALGRPVVVAQTSGLAELVEIGWVRGVAAQASAEAVARVIIEQMDHPDAVDASALPTWESCACALARVYDEILRPDRVPTGTP